MLPFGYVTEDKKERVPKPVCSGERGADFLDDILTFASKALLSVSSS